MPKKKKIKKTKINHSGSSGIRPTELPQPQGISFSFKYFHSSHEKFNCDGKDGSYWLTLIARLKDLSALTALELLRNRNRSLRCHPIDWQDTSESCFGIPNEEQLVDTPYQFSLSSNEHGRVHGFFINQVFYIVWLDPNHLLYPGK
ncbi:MAG: hypothetical protein AB4372_09810 [Xenococcus sp. (in: cyanobacteria)]